MALILPPKNPYNYTDLSAQIFAVLGKDLARPQLAGLPLGGTGIGKRATIVLWNQPRRDAGAGTWIEPGSAVHFMHVLATLPHPWTLAPLCPAAHT